MASYAHAQSPVACDLCGNALDGYHFCRVCEETMCSACKVIHNKGKATRDHEVVLRVKRDTDQSSSKACSQHPGQMHTLCCEDCMQPICSKCITDTHKGHNMCEPAAAAAVMKKRLSKEINDIEGQTIPDVEMSLDTIRKQTNDYDQQVQRAMNDVRAEAGIFKIVSQEVLELYTKMEDELGDIQGHNNNVSESKQKSMTDCLSELRKNLTLYKDKLTCEDDIELINFMNTKSNVDHLNMLKTNASDMQVVPPSFQPGTLDKQDIIRKIGAIMTSAKSPDPMTNPMKEPEVIKSTVPLPKLTDPNKTPEVIKSIVSSSKFNALDRYYPFICTTAGGKAWVSRTESCVVELVDTYGKSYTSIIVPQPRFVAVLPNREVLVVSSKNKIVHKIDRDGNLETILKSEDWSPKGISKTGDNQFLLCQTKDKIVRIIRCSGKGEILQIIVPVDKEGKAVLQKPLFITESDSGNICISDYVLHKVFFFDKQGVLQNTYGGSSMGRKQFVPKGLCSDKRGHVLVADYDNNSIHVLSEDGNLIKHLMGNERELKWPYDLSCDDTSVWVTTSDSVAVFLY